MRAKIQLYSVKQVLDTNGYIVAEELAGSPVCGSFGPNGESEDNTFARYTPCGRVELTINNPDLMGKFRPGQKFYVDFTPAE